MRVALLECAQSLTALRFSAGMTRLGFDLAGRLEGRLVDDNGRAVSEGLNRDRARLVACYQRMQARGIPAG